MAWMETFCFYCSVRLGVIASAIISFMQELVSIILISIYGLPAFRNFKRFIERDEQLSQEPLVRKMLEGFSERPRSYVIVLDCYIVVHMVACVSAVYGAFQLKKSYLIPYMITQFIMLCGVLAEHIIAMIILKKIVSLEILIGITLAGGFYILFIGYSWAGGVALFQIIILVNSQKYKTLYGEDPMAPRECNEILLNHGTIANVKIFSTPNNSQISAIKRKRLIEEQQQQRFGRKIISVIPVHQSDNNDDNDVINFNNWHWNELVSVRKGFK